MPPSPVPELYWVDLPSIIVDDSDPAIRYNGQWHIANETEIQSNFFQERTPYFNTLHVLQIFSGSISYDFTGAGVSVFATPYDNSSYTSQCFLDGNEIQFDPNATKAQFGQSRPVCQAFGLPDNIIHTVSVNISVPPRQQQDLNGPLSGFAFDYMLIEPSSNLSPWDNGNQDVLLQVLDIRGIQMAQHPTLNSAIVLEDPSGHIANFSTEWKFDPKNGFNTTVPGSQFNLTFIGTSLWWYGYYAVPDVVGTPLSPHPAATFSIDGGAPSNLSDVQVVTSSQALFFRTPVLKYGSHLLTVVCHGTNTTLALTLQSLIVQKSTQTVSNSTVVPLTTPTISKSAPFISKSATPIPKPSTPPVVNKDGKPGAIVGIIIGVVVFLLLVGYSLRFMIRRAKRERRSMQTRKDGTTITPEPLPVPTDLSVGTLAPQKAQINQQRVDNPFMQQEFQPPPLTKWTRRHAISGSQEHMHNPTTAPIQQPEHPEPRMNDPPAQHSDETRRANTGPADSQPTIPIGGALHPSARDVVVSTTVPADRVEHEEDSGLRMSFVPVLPPLYTTL